MRAGRPPTLDELSALAARALQRVPGDGIADVLWERRGAERLSVAVTAVHDGRAARVVADGTEEHRLTRAGKAASLHARQARAWPAPPLPPPGVRVRTVPVAPELLEADLTGAAAAAGAGVAVTWDAGASRSAVAASNGLRSTEARTHAIARLGADRPDGRRAAVTVAGIGCRSSDAADGSVPWITPAVMAGAGAEVRALLGEGDDAGPFAPRVPMARAAPPDGDPRVVLGPEAMAAVLDQLRGAFGVELALRSGVLAGRTGEPVAAPVVTLRDDAGHPGTLPRGVDAEGVARRAVDLVREGVAAGPVHDCASAAAAGTATTGHGTRPLTPAPYPDHLVLDGGEAPDVAALVREARDGVFIPAVGPVTDRIDGGRVHAAAAAPIRAGRLAGWTAIEVEVRALDVLAAVQALTAPQRLVPLRGQCPGGSGAAVVPAVLARGGVRLR